MKNLKNLSGFTIIQKNNQKTINGGFYPHTNCAHYNCVIEVNPITGDCFCAED